MTSLLEDAHALAGAASRVGTLRAHAKQAELWVSRAQVVRALSSELAASYASLRWFVDRGLASPLPPNVFNAARERVSSVRDLLESDAGQFAQGAQVAELQQAVHAAIGAVRSAVGAYWRSYLESRVGPPRSQLLEALGADPRPAVREVLASARSIDGKLNAFRGLELPAAEDLEVVESLCAQRDALDVEKHLDLPADVRVFIEEAASGVADLERLTPEVLDWLRANGLVGQYAIGVRPTRAGR